MQWRMIACLNYRKKAIFIINFVIIVALKDTKMDNFLEKTYKENKDTLKIELTVKNFKEIYSFLKTFEKKLNKLQIFNIKTEIEINWKDENCRF